MGRGSIYHGERVKISWIGGSNTMVMGVDIPWIVGKNTMGRGVDIKWVWGSKYHG